MQRRGIYSSNTYKVVPSDVYFLGMIPDVNLGGANNKDPDVQLIDKVEESQVKTCPPCGTTALITYVSQLNFCTKINV